MGQGHGLNVSARSGVSLNTHTRAKESAEAMRWIKGCRWRQWGRVERERWTSGTHFSPDCLLCRTPPASGRRLDTPLATSTPRREIYPRRALRRCVCPARVVLSPIHRCSWNSGCRWCLDARQRVSESQVMNAEYRTGRKTNVRSATVQCRDRQCRVFLRRCRLGTAMWDVYVHLAKGPLSDRPNGPRSTSRRNGGEG